MKNQANMLKQLQEMQAKMAQLQDELAVQTYTGSAGGGAVTATVNGSQEFTEVVISPDALDDAELLADMVMAACNQALQAMRDGAAQQMGQLLPPGML